MNCTHCEENIHILLAALLNFSVLRYIMENTDLSWDEEFCMAHDGFLSKG